MAQLKVRFRLEGLRRTPKSPHKTVVFVQSVCTNTTTKQLSFIFWLVNLEEQKHLHYQTAVSSN